MSNAVAIKPQGRSVLIDMASRFGMEPQAFEATVRATCIKTASREEFAAFLLVAKEYGLNPLTKEIYAFPAKGGGIVPVVSIDGWVNLVNSHGACDGFEFEMNHDGDGKLVSCTCRMYRKDRSRPVIVTEYLEECKRGTEPWKMQHRMLRHKAMIQAARYAFGFSGIYDEDEGEKIAEMRDVTPREEPPAPPPLPVQIFPPADEPPATEQVVAEQADVPDHPDPKNDPDAFLKWMDEKFAAIPHDMGETIGMIWEETVEPLLDDLFPPDRGIAEATYRKHCKRLGVG